MPTHYLTVSEVARLFRVDVHTLHQQRWRNAEPGSLGFKVNGRLLYDPEDLSSYVDRVKAAERRDREARLAALDAK